MAKTTGIAWTDSTYNSWWGCTKVGPACDDCYAEDVDKRSAGDNHWGHGVARRRISEKVRNEPYRWQREADAFRAEHGRDRRVFTLSMGDLFDNEVEKAWRNDHMDTMTACNRLRWQICTKRVSNIAKMVPPSWRDCWPAHIGVLITIVTQAEAARDVPRLEELKRWYDIPWIGISYEPAQEAVDWSPYKSLDWIIFGGKSGRQWNDRPFSLDWARSTMAQCADLGAAFFMKQVAAFRPTEDMIPRDLMVREFPEALR